MSEEPLPENQRQEPEWVQVWREFLNHMRVVRQENQRREQALLRTPKKAIVEAIYTFAVSILVISAATLQLLEWISTKTVPWYEYASMTAVDILCVVGLIASGKKLLIFQHPPIQTKTYACGTRRGTSTRITRGSYLSQTQSIVFLLLETRIKDNEEARRRIGLHSNNRFMLKFLLCRQYGTIASTNMHKNN